MHRNLPLFLQSDSYPQYPWPQLIPVPSCSPRYFICLYYLSQLCLIRRLEPFETQERFLTNDNFQNVDLTKERVKRQIRMIKADTQRHYMMFFSKIANEKRERIEYEKTKYELDERIYKLIDYLEKIKQKTEIIDGRTTFFVPFESSFSALFVKVHLINHKLSMKINLNSFQI